MNDIGAIDFKFTNKLELMLWCSENTFDPSLIIKNKSNETENNKHNTESIDTGADRMHEHGLGYGAGTSGI